MSIAIADANLSHGRAQEHIKDLESKFDAVIHEMGVIRQVWPFSQFPFKAASCPVTCQAMCD